MQLDLSKVIFCLHDDCFRTFTLVSSNESDVVINGVGEMGLAQISEGGVS